MSADGCRIVGLTSSDRGEEAFLWDSTDGIRSLQDVLVEAWLAIIPEPSTALLFGSGLAALARLRRRH